MLPIHVLYCFVHRQHINYVCMYACMYVSDAPHSRGILLRLSMLEAYSFLRSAAVFPAFDFNFSSVETPSTLRMPFLIPELPVYVFPNRCLRRPDDMLLPGFRLVCDTFFSPFAKRFWGTDAFFSLKEFVG